MHNQYSIANGLNFGCNVHVCGDHITWLSPYDRKMCGCHKMPVQPHAIYHRRRYLRCKRISKFGSTLCTPKIFVYHQDRIITMFTFICIYTFVFHSFFFFSFNIFLGCQHLPLLLTKYLYSLERGTPSRLDAVAIVRMGKGECSASAGASVCLALIFGFLLRLFAIKMV